MTLVGIAVLGFVLRPVFLPDDFGKYGHYRPGAVADEAAREIRSPANEACFECHPLIRKLHVAGVHKDMLCEVCHGSNADHVRNEKWYAVMPTARDQEIRLQCLGCHNEVVQALPPEAMKMVALPKHLEDRKVRTHHVCNQCHHVHAPLKWVHEAREMMGLPIDKGES